MPQIVPTLLDQRICIVFSYIGIDLPVSQQLQILVTQLTGCWLSVSFAIVEKYFILNLLG